MRKEYVLSGASPDHKEENTQNKEENNIEYENRICAFWCQPRSQ